MSDGQSAAIVAKAVNEDIAACADIEPGAPEPATIGVVLKGYPRLSETFIAQELAGLEGRGFTLHLVSLRHPTDTRRHPVHERIAASVTYLPEYVYQEPRRVVRAWRAVRTWSTYPDVYRTWWRDFRRDPSPNRGRRFAQAMVLAHELKGSVDWLYAHFMHTPASVARYASALLGIDWSMSAHAKDVWTIPSWEKREKLESARWLTTCTAANVAHLTPLAPSPDRVILAYHGLDPSAFPAPPSRVHREGETVTLLSVGRAVEKKGYDTLLQALARLPADLNWRFRHVGGGELLPRLKGLATRLGVGDRVEWSGSMTQPEVLEAMRAADIFVLASRITEAGDRDGLPNVLMEASSQGLACLATTVSGIPELIRTEETGLLVEPENAEALAEALTRLIGDPVLRARLGAGGQERVRDAFSPERGLDTLCERFRQSGIDAVRTARGNV